MVNNQDMKTIASISLAVAGGLILANILKKGITAVRATSLDATQTVVPKTPVELAPGVIKHIAADRTKEFFMR